MALFVRRYETQQLVELLTAAVEAENYDVITYDQMEKLVGLDVSNGHRSILVTAIRAVQKATNRLFGTIRSQGVKLLTPIEQASEPQAAIRKVRSVAQRGISRLQSVQYDRLEQSAKVQHNMAASVLGVMQMMTSPKALKAVESKADAAKLAIGDTLRLFSNGKDGE